VLRHRTTILAVIALPLALVVLAPHVRADVIVLKNGNEIQGEVLKESKNRVVIKFPGGILQLKRKDIVEIRKQKREKYLLDVGEGQLRRKSFHDAIETFETALKETPDSEPLARKHREARTKYAAQLASWRRYDESVALYKELLREQPNDEQIADEVEFLENERAEVLAEEKRGREELENGDFETGVWRLQKIYDNFPDRRESVAEPLVGGFIKQATDLRKRRRWTDAAIRLEQALAISPIVVEKVRPAYVECKVHSMTPYAKKGDFETMEKMAREGLEVAPSNPTLNYFLGFAYDGQGNDTKAAQLYAAVLDERLPSNAAREVNRLRKRAEALIAKRNPTVDGLRENASMEVLAGDFRRIKTPHFRIHHKNTQVGKAIAFAAEAAYRELFPAIGCTTHWRNPCQVTVFPSKEEYLRNNPVGEWSGAAHRLSSRRGIFSEHSIVTYQGQPRLTDGLLKHEIAHALLTHRLNYPKSIPLWSTEGFAVYTEPAYMHQYYDRICAQAKSQNVLIPIERLFDSETYPDNQVQLFYGQSYSVVKYLIERKGLKRYLEFLRDITANGLEMKRALKKHYRFEAQLALENRWRYTLGKR